MKTSKVNLGIVLAIGMTTLFLTGCGQPESPTASAAQPVAQKPGAPADMAADQPGGKLAEHGEAGHGEAETLKLTPEAIQTAGIKIEALAEQEISEQLMLTATIQPNQDRITHVAARVPGRIVKVHVKLGDQVKAGQTLALLDSLEVGEAYSTYLQAKTQLAVAKADFERAEKLHGDQIIAQKDHLRAHAEYDKAKASFAATGDKLRMLGVSPAPADDGRAVSTFPLTTPFAGTVIEKHAILGELAQPDKQIFTVADLSRLWIEANLFEKDLGRIKTGAAAVVTVDAYPGESFQGRLTYIAAVVDKDTRTVQARVEVANPGGRLKPEMFATAAIRTSGTAGAAGKGKALLLPQEAVVLMQGQPTAFVEERGGFEPRAVELGEKLRERVVIKNGLKAGERVVTAGAYALKARLLKSQISDEH
ncbi:MAG: efflux RND transporter periplasmic adaptor subunit [Betaproteobacteria bacterium]|nr:efflux RND transporter periplasmic adaptor subunit [Betaproteobacteria bacterium]